MPLKVSLKQPLFIASIAGIIFSLAVILSLVFDLPVQGSSAKSVPPQSSQTPPKQMAGQPAAAFPVAAFSKPAGSVLPIRLKIPKINVNAALESVGLTSDGSMGVPKYPANVGWFNLGPRPGDIGSAVLAGHYGRWKNGQGSVFDNLSKLRPGDKIYVTDDKGSIIVFVVRELRSYGPNADASDVFVSNDGKAHLNLITCEGAWNKTSKSYPKRLVVFADKE